MKTNQSQTIARSRTISTKEIVLVGMFAAVLAIISQISIPMPTGVPITIQLFGVTLIGVVLGWKLGLFATLVYILIGAAGVPVFSNFRGGISVLASFTGGYILGWPLMVIFCGIRHNTSSKTRNLMLTILFALIGLAIDETIGGLQWAALSGDMTTKAVFIYSITAFVPKDILLTVLAVIVGTQMKKSLARIQ